MAIIDQKITEQYAIYHGDCVEALPELKDQSVHIIIYSPPFSDLYNYSSSERDISNNKSYEDFLQHYEYVVKETARVLMPGRISCVHCVDIPQKGAKGLLDFPGDIIRLHERHGFYYAGRRVIWRDPLWMAIRSRAKHLMHRQIVKDSAYCDVAGADFLLSFRKKGTNKIQIVHPHGLSIYAGENQPPPELIKQYKNWKDPKTNKLSHYIWQRYASSVWMDIRMANVLEYKEAKETDEERHVCPLQLDVIERCLILWSNPGEILLTPFLGVGSEVCGALRNGRKGIGIELKASYYRQAQKNIEQTLLEIKQTTPTLFD